MPCSLLQYCAPSAHCYNIVELWRLGTRSHLYPWEQWLTFAPLKALRSIRSFRTHLNIMPLLRLLPLLLCHIATLWIPSARAGTARLLIYSATLGFRHESIPAAIGALKRSGPSIDAIFEATEDSSKFNVGTLDEYDALIFLSTTGDGKTIIWLHHGNSDPDSVQVLQNDELDAFQWYINAGGNFVGIHAASDALRNFKAYTQELGAFPKEYIYIFARTYDITIRISFWLSRSSPNLCAF